VDISWGGEIIGTKNGVWFGNGHGVWNTCDDYMYPPSLPTANSTYQVVIDFRVVQRGDISDAVVEKSSGNIALDSATLECTHTWENADRLFVGPNLNVRMRAKITWRDGHAFVLESLVQ
jgi:TonB family protein